MTTSSVNQNTDMDMNMNMAENRGTQTESLVPSSIASSQNGLVPGASLPQGHSNRKPRKSSKSAFHNLPPEIRRMIYKELLMNPVLGTQEAIEKSIGYGVKAVYGLTPAILRTCREIYMEAVEVLYNQTFIIKCDYYHQRVSTALDCNYPCPCPLLRNLVRPRGSTRRLEIPAQSMAMTMARSWKVLVDPSMTEKNLHQQFYEFCKAICDARPKNIEIIVLKTSRTRFATDYEPASNIDCLEPWKTLAPVTLLRNVGTLSIRNEHAPYLHEADNVKPDKIFWESHGPGKLLNRMLRTLAQSDRPIERLFKMKTYLVRLAQSFERYIPFKLDMYFPKSLQSLSKPQEEYADELEKLGLASYLRYQVPNPYNYGRESYNDLESYLSDAADATLSVQTLEFKAHRVRVVENLKPQYDRLLAASEKIKVFKSNMPQQNNFHGSQSSFHTACATLLVMIEGYAADFERRKNLQTQAEFRRQKRRFDRLHATWPREMLLARLDTMMEEGNLVGFPGVAQEVIDDMDEQLLEMTEAWENLFKADEYPGERSCILKFDRTLEDFSSSDSEDEESY